MSMTNLIQSRVRFRQWFLISTLSIFILLAGCSYGVGRLVRLFPDVRTTPVDTFHLLDELVNEWPEFNRESKCAEDGIYFMNTYRSRGNQAVHVALVFNSSNGLLAFDYGQLGVRKFTPDAEHLFQDLTSRLRKRFGEQVMVVSVSDTPAFVSNLKGGDRRLHYCVEKK